MKYWNKNSIFYLFWRQGQAANPNPCTESAIQFSVQNCKRKGHFNFQFSNKNWKMKIKNFLYHFSIFNFELKIQMCQNVLFYCNFKLKIEMEKDIFAHLNFNFKIENWKMIKIFQFSFFNFYWKIENWKFIFHVSILEFNCQITQVEKSWLAFF